MVILHFILYFAIKFDLLMFSNIPHICDNFNTYRRVKSVLFGCLLKHQQQNGCHCTNEICFVKTHLVGEFVKKNNFKLPYKTKVN